MAANEYWAHASGLTANNRDGFYTGSGHDMLLKPSISKGGHGFDPERSGHAPSFISNGSAVHVHGSIGVVKMAQISR